jgi:pSer/pThr/pTyr-binding forkhead associated (FHA) protein
MKLSLRILGTTSAASSTLFQHAGPTVVIGREPACELHLSGAASQAVSGRHACITLTPDGATVKDLGSSNGTFVNDRRVGSEQPLHVGDQIRLGQSGPILRVVALDLDEEGGEPLPATDPDVALPAVAAPPAALGKLETPRAKAPKRRKDAAPSPKAPAATPRPLLQVQAARRRLWVLAGAGTAGVLAVLTVVFLMLQGRGGSPAKEPDTKTEQPAAAVTKTKQPAAEELKSDPLVAEVKNEAEKPAEPSKAGPPSKEQDEKPVEPSKTALPPEKGDEGLALVNDRFTYGHLGAERPGDAFLPGEVLALAYEVANLKTDPQGKFSCATSIEAFDPAGQRIYRQAPQPVSTQNYLGGQRLPGTAYLTLPLQQAAGDYKIRITVEDRTAKASKALERRFRILPAGFGLVQVYTSADVEGKYPAPPVGVKGGTLYVNFGVVGFARDPGTKQPNLEAALQLIDDKGQATLAEPVLGKVNSDVPPDMQIVPLQFAVALNRVGRFTVELSATDVLNRKSARVTFPIKVVAIE